MIHHMTLAPEPFEMIASGQKNIELRLYDKKRQRIKPGDRIQFTCQNHQIDTEVTALYVFDSFAELYQSLPLLQCGYPQELQDKYSGMVDNLATEIFFPYKKAVTDFDGEVGKLTFSSKCTIKNTKLISVFRGSLLFTF